MYFLIVGLHCQHSQADNEGWQKNGLSHHHRLANFLLYLCLLDNSSHSTTQVVPCTHFLGCSIHSHLDLVRPDVSRQVCLKQDLQKGHHDQHAHEHNFMVGQRVMVRNYRLGPVWMPGTTTQAQRPLTFIVCVESGQLWKRHVDQLKSLSTRKLTSVCVLTYSPICTNLSLPA